MDHRSTAIGCPRPSPRPHLLAAYAFLGAFLMFTVEPLVGRIVVPQCGGSMYVWATCLMFFQGALFAGYLYAHLIGPKIGRLHLLVVAAPLLLLPLEIHAAPGDHPIASLLVALARDVGPLVAVLATTSVLAQAWLARATGDGADPYWLYAASNAGSLGGLLAYPLLVEPWLGLERQRLLWAIGYLLYLALSAAVAPGRPTQAEREEQESKPWWEQPDPYLPRSIQWYWFVLTAAPSIMLVAATNAISFDVGSIPLAWVAPLAIYLVSFVLTFRSKPLAGGWLRRLWPELGLLGFAIAAAPNPLPSYPTIALHLVVLLGLCLAAHGELYRVRPASHHLTRYYLIVAAGGWAGGTFASILAPFLFDRLYEYPAAIVLLVTAFAVARAPRLGGILAGRRPRLEGLVRVPVASAAVGLSAVLLMPAPGGEQAVVLRNPYGLYRIGIRHHPATGAEPAIDERYLLHNGTIHGGQLLVEGGGRLPIGYYHPASGVADAMAVLPRPRRVAVIGLGTGSMAAYFGPGEEVTFYEIDPDGERIARAYFDYLKATRAFVRVVTGDARIELARDLQAPDGSYDAVIVDAFSGDAIPVHLLTREAIALYRAKIRPGGLLVFHISNRFYDLRGVLRATLEAEGLPSMVKHRPPGPSLERFENPSTYVAATTDPALRQALAGRGWQDLQAAAEIGRPTPWSDDYVNVLAPLWAKLTSPRAKR